MTPHQRLRSSIAFLAFAAHNAEEAIFAKDWALANSAWLVEYTGRDLAKIWAGPGFRLSLLGLTAVLLALAVAAAQARPRSLAVYLLLGVVAVFAANAVYPHIALALALGGYVPGVATALLAVLPVAAWVYASSIREAYASRRGALAAATIGIALYSLVAGLVLIR